MSRWMQPIVSLVLVAVFGGGPAIAATCAALCGPAMSHGGHAMASPDTSAASHHDTTVPEPDVVAAVDEADHARHHHEADAQSDRTSATVAPAAAVTRGGDCCTEVDAALTASVVSVRSATVAPIAMPASVIVPLRTDVLQRSDTGLAIAAVPLSSPRTPLVLRI